MIPRAAIEAFLQKPRDDHRWVKQLTHKELDLALAELNPPPQLYPGLHLHQKASVLLGLANPEFAFWEDMGSGKTLTSLELLRYWYESGRIRRALIFVISDKAFDTWEKQIDKFGIEVPRVTLEGSSEEKWDRLRRFKQGFVILTYPGAVAMVSDRGDGKWRLDRKKVAELSRDAGAMVLDESTKVSGHRSLSHKLVASLRSCIPICYALAGRPFGRDPTLLWAQQLLVDRGASLGPTIGLFREAFFNHHESHWNPYGEWTFRQSMQPELNRILQHRSITYTAEECVDLPACRHLVEGVHLPEDGADYYKLAVASLIAAKGNMRAVKNVFLRMRQMSSGFLGFKDDETGERAELEFSNNPKFELLTELIDDLPADRGAVVFYEFTVSGRRIYEAFADRAIWLWSGTKDPRSDLRRFQKDPACNIAVINNKVGAYSLDGLQEKANYAFFFESPVSCIDREQAERRIVRQGQKRKCFIYDLIAYNTMDQRILAYHKMGEDLFQALMKDPLGA